MCCAYSCGDKKSAVNDVSKSNDVVQSSEVASSSGVSASSDVTMSDIVAVTERGAQTPEELAELFVKYTSCQDYEKTMALYASDKDGEAFLGSKDAFTFDAPTDENGYAYGLKIDYTIKNTVVAEEGENGKTVTVTVEVKVADIMPLEKFAELVPSYDAYQNGDVDGDGIASEQEIGLIYAELQAKIGEVLAEQEFKLHIEQINNRWCIVSVDES